MNADSSLISRRKFLQTMVFCRSDRARAQVLRQKKWLFYELEVHHKSLKSFDNLLMLCSSNTIWYVFTYKIKIHWKPSYHSNNNRISTCLFNINDFQFDILFWYGIYTIRNRSKCSLFINSIIFNGTSNLWIIRRVFDVFHCPKHFRIILVCHLAMGISIQFPFSLNKSNSVFVLFSFALFCRHI